MASPTKETGVKRKRRDSNILRRRHTKIRKLTARKETVGKFLDSLLK